MPVERTAENPLGLDANAPSLADISKSLMVDVKENTPPPSASEVDDDVRDIADAPSGGNEDASSTPVKDEDDELSVLDEADENDSDESEDVDADHTDDTEDPDEDEDNSLLDEADEEAQGADTVDADQGEVYEIAPDAVVQVTVDGETVEVPFSELTATYSGEAAIEARLSEAGQARSEAIQTLSQARTTFQHLLNAVGDRLFTVDVQEPDESLAESNPAKYLAEVTKYQKAVEASKQGKLQLANTLVALEQAADAERKKARRAEGAKLKKAAPELFAPNTGKQLQTAMLNNAKSAYGFTDEEIKQASSAGLFRMALDAYKYRQSQMNKAEQNSKGKVTHLKGAKKRRSLPAVGSNRGDNSAKVSAVRKQKALEDQAYKTGRPEDVARTMLVPAKPTRRRR